MGGTFIVNKQGDVIYAHVQQGYTDYPKVDNMITCIDIYLKNINFDAVEVEL